MDTWRLWCAHCARALPCPTLFLLHDSLPRSPRTPLHSVPHAPPHSAILAPIHGPLPHQADPSPPHASRPTARAAPRASCGAKISVPRVSWRPQECARRPGQRVLHQIKSKARLARGALAPGAPRVTRGCLRPPAGAGGDLRSLQKPPDKSCPNVTPFLETILPGF